MNRPDRIRDLLEYYLGEELLEDWNCEEMRGWGRKKWEKPWP